MTKADCEKKKDLRERLLGVMIPPGLLPRLPWWHILGYFTILKRKTLGRNVYNDDPARADSTNSLSDNFCTAEEYLVAVIFALRRPSLRSGQSQRGTFSPICCHQLQWLPLSSDSISALIILILWYIQPDASRHWIFKTLFPGQEMDELFGSGASDFKHYTRQHLSL